jgi:type I restriction enzyme M protein
MYSNITEKRLWNAAEKLRSNLDAAEYKHVILGLLFLKQISVIFDYYNSQIIDNNTIFERKEFFSERNLVWIPEGAHWDTILEQVHEKDEVAQIIDNAMSVIEDENQSLHDVFARKICSLELEKGRILEIIKIIDEVSFETSNNNIDVIGSVYEYYLGKFAEAEGINGGQYYTPRCLVQLMVNMIEPFFGKIYDPCCGLGGMFVQSQKIINRSQRKTSVSIYGQESNPNTWRLCKMNLALHGINGYISRGDSLMNNQHKGFKADYILANPPFNDKDWRREELLDDERWIFGLPPSRNANFAWIQHIIFHLAPQGTACVAMTNSSLFATKSKEGIIRKNIIDADLVDCIVALPPNLFFNTRIPACLWILRKDKKNSESKKQSNEILFINAKQMGTMITKRHREFNLKDIQIISNTYLTWKKNLSRYQNIGGFCKSTSREEIIENNYLLSPLRYVGFQSSSDSDILSEIELNTLISDYIEISKHAKIIDDEIINNLKKMRFENFSN